MDKLLFGFALFAGSEKNILKKCETIAKEASVGILMFFVCVFAAVSGTFAAFHYSHSVELKLHHILFGIVWGSLVYAIDRAMVVTLRKKSLEESSRNIGAFLTRFAIGFVLSFFIAVPYDTIVFKKEIDRQKIVNSQRDENNAKEKQEKIDGIVDLQNNDTQLEKSISRLDQRLREGCPDPDYARKMSEYTRFNNRYRQLSSRYAYLKNNNMPVPPELVSAMRNNKAQANARYKEAQVIKNKYYAALREKKNSFETQQDENKNKLNAGLARVESVKKDIRDVTSGDIGISQEFTLLKDAALENPLSTGLLIIALHLGLVMLETIVIIVKMWPGASEYEIKIFEYLDGVKNEAMRKAGGWKKKNEHDDKFEAEERMRDFEIFQKEQQRKVVEWEKDKAELDKKRALEEKIESEKKAKYYESETLAIEKENELKKMHENNLFEINKAYAQEQYNELLKEFRNPDILSELLQKINRG
jgi:hypothetical protein